MGKICTVAIHKGGTGKTTVSAHLAFLDAEQGSRTLLIDLDSQGKVHAGFGERRPETDEPQGLHGAGRLLNPSCSVRRSGRISTCTSSSTSSAATSSAG